MANRRMFSKSITSSSKFLMMSLTAQALYFHFGMNADDDGFCEHFTVMRMVEAKPDDLKVLQARGLVKVFDDRVLVILDWKENNLIRLDRYTPSKYLEEYKDEVAALSGIPAVDQRLPQVRLGKDRVGEDTLMIVTEEISLRKPKSNLDGFESWWALYPKRQNKPGASAEWRKLTPEDRAAATKGASRVAVVKGRDPQFLPMPGNYLRDRRWEDEDAAKIEPETYQF